MGNPALWNEPLWGGGSVTPERYVTGGGLCYGALRLLGILRTGYTSNPEMQADALIELNDMLDSWHTEKLTVPAMERAVYALIPGQAAYTIGRLDTASYPGVPRPQRIERAAKILAGDTAETPIDVITLEQWAAGRNGLYSDQAFPLATLNLRPTPTTDDTSLVLYTWAELGGFSDMVTPKYVPPGYALAIRYNLAVQLAPAMAIHTKSPIVLRDEIIRQAAEYKGRIKSHNITPILMDVDPALLSRPGFDILRGY